MPDPLCRVHDVSVARIPQQPCDQWPGRLIPPDELPCLLFALGRTVRQLRAVAGHSQETLGSDAQLHRNYVGAIERGEINPTLRVLSKLACGLRMPASALLAMAEQLAGDPRVRDRSESA